MIDGASVTGQERDVLKTLVDLSEKTKRKPVSAGDITALLNGAVKQNNVRVMLLRLLQKGLATREGQGAWRPTTGGRAMARKTHCPDVGLLKPVDEDGNEAPGLFD